MKWMKTLLHCNHHLFVCFLFMFWWFSKSDSMEIEVALWKFLSICLNILQIFVVLAKSISRINIWKFLESAFENQKSTNNLSRMQENCCKKENSIHFFNFKSNSESNAPRREDFWNFLNSLIFEYPYHFWKNIDHEEIGKNDL